MQTITRPASLAELGRIMQIENAGFPPSERCTPALMAARFKAFPDWCFAAWRGGQLAGFVHGMGVLAPFMQDAFYYLPSLHAPLAPWQCVLGLAVAPEFRRQGIGRHLMGFYAGMAQARGRQGLVLACKQELVPFYAPIGFECAGTSQSRYGGGAWLDMVWRF